MENAYIARTIKSLCNAKGITISTLLADCGLTKSFIYDLEKRSASPSCDKLARIADYFQVPIDYLVGTGIYGQIAQNPKMKQAIAVKIDEVLGPDFLKKLGIQSIASLDIVTFGKLASLLVESVSYNQVTNQVEIVLKNFPGRTNNPEIGK